MFLSTTPQQITVADATFQSLLYFCRRICLSFRLSRTSDFDTTLWEAFSCYLVQGWPKQSQFSWQYLMKECRESMQLFHFVLCHERQQQISSKRSEQLKRHLSLRNQLAWKYLMTMKGGTAYWLDLEKRRTAGISHKNASSTVPEDVFQNTMGHLSTRGVSACRFRVLEGREMEDSTFEGVKNVLVYE